MHPRALLFASVAALALAVGGCPNPPSTPDADGGEPPGDVLDANTTPEVALELPSGECQTAADCEAAFGGVLPACQALACEEARCVLVAGDEGGACAPTDACSTTGTCQDGACVGDAAAACDDGNPCTTDACDPAGGCVHTYNGKPCDDGSVCTTDDHCSLGACVGAEVSCDDANPCTDDSCDAVTGCTWADNLAGCDDGDACTAGDLCVGGACIAGAEVDCDDGEACTQESCDSALGCVTTILEGACDDANACTTGDTCKDGVCVGEIVTCDDGNVCTGAAGSGKDYCDPTAGCVYTANVGACDDGEPCTLGDVCSDTVCQPGSPDPLCCEADGDCDDGDPCTDDACVSEYCAFVKRTCDDGHPCTADFCAGGECFNDPYGPLASGAIIDEGFEAGLASWQLETNSPDVLWQLDTSKAHAGATSLYCGNIPAYSYDFPPADGEFGLTARASRTLSVPPSTKATLSFWMLQDLEESGSCSYDVTRVYVDAQVLQPELCSSLTAFTQQSYDLTAWAGQTVTVTFEFATGDGIANDGQGVWLDDVQLIVDSPQGCCLEDTDCAGGDGCLAELCHPEAKACQVLEGALACDDGQPCTIDACEADATCSHTDDPACCEADGECPAHDTLACAVPVCVDNACGFDESACCAEDTDCPADPAQVCATPICNAGTCELDASTCCASDGDCPAHPDQVCAQPVCGADQICTFDQSLCCHGDASKCPEHASGACAVASCNADDTCEYDTSGCP